MRLPLPLVVLLLASPAFAADWKPAPAPLMTKWGKQITADKTPWAEYPRPQLVRKDWQNLNGLWDYAIRPKGEKQPDKWDGKILVPFCAESALSGVGKHPTEKDELWYRRDIDASAWKGRRVRLNFDAVDWEATVWVNGKEVGTHKGMHDPFSFDITDSLKDGKGELVVRVWDPTDKGSQPLGKQISNPHGIWYTPVTGIWQTVWMEPVGETHITRVSFTPLVDKGEVECVVEVTGGGGADLRVLVVVDGHKLQGQGRVGENGKPGQPIRLKLPDPKLWSPDTPDLYPAQVSLSRAAGGGMMQSLEFVDTYFAFRSVGVASPR